MLCYPPTPFHTASSISHRPFFIQQPPSSIVHRLTYIRLKNTMFVLRPLSLRWRAFSFSGCNFTMKHQKRLHGLHRRADGYSNVLSRFRFAKYSEIDLKLSPKQLLPTLAGQYHDFVLSFYQGRFVFRMIMAFLGVFGACFCGGKFARGLTHEKTHLPPRIFF